MAKLSDKRLVALTAIIENGSVFAISAVTKKAIIIDLLDTIDTLKAEKAELWRLLRLSGEVQDE